MERQAAVSPKSVKPLTRSPLSVPLGATNAHTTMRDADAQRDAQVQSAECGMRGAAGL